MGGTSTPTSGHSCPGMAAGGRGGRGAGQGNGSSPNSSWIRRRSRIRGSVSPPTQRPTVFTDTPSWRAAASWVRPSRRRVDDIQSAKVAGRAGRLPATARAGRGRRAHRLRDGVVGVQDVHLDVLGEDAERDLDRAGRPGRVEQGAEDGLADLPVALLGERRLGQAAADEVADLGNPGWAGGERLGQDHHRDDLDLARPRARGSGLAPPVSPSHSPASTAGPVGRVRPAADTCPLPEAHLTSGGLDSRN